MWLSKRGFLTGAALVALAACGFTPAYGPGAPGQKLQNAILVQEPGNHDTYIITRRIEERLGRTSTPRYTLDLALAVTSERMALTRSEVAARFNVIGKLSYTLKDAVTGVGLTSGTVDGFTGYSSTGTPLASQSAERDARDRLSVLLADQLVTRLMAAAPDLP